MAKKAAPVETPKAGWGLLTVSQIALDQTQASQTNFSNLDDLMWVDA